MTSPPVTREADMASLDEQGRLEIAIELAWLVLREAEAWESSSIELIDVMSVAAPSELLETIAAGGHMPDDVSGRLMRCIRRLADVSEVSRRVASRC